MYENYTLTFECIKLDDKFTFVWHEHYQDSKQQNSTALFLPNELYED